MADDNKVIEFVRRGQAAQQAVDAAVAAVDLTQLTDAELAEACAKDPWPGNMELTLRPASVFRLVTILQLALRDPSMTTHPEEVALARTFIDSTHEYFADCPHLREVIRRGDDPARDR